MFTGRHRESREKPVLLDGQYLERLESHLGEAALRELLSDGLLELSDRIDRIPKLAEADDRDELARLLHDVVGMAGHLGLTRLSHAAVTAGRAFQTDGSGAPDAVDPVLASAPEAISAIRDFLDGEPQD